MQKKTRILLIGPYPPPIGGSRVLFKQLVDNLIKHPQIEVQIVKIPELHFTSLKSWMSLLRKFWYVLWYIPQYQIVSLHATAHQAVILGILVWLECSILRKKTNFRKFGGVFDQEYEKFPRMVKTLINHTILRMDLVMFETQALVDYFSSITTRPVIWYPNNRPLAENFDLKKLTRFEEGARKFVFIGHVKPSKGIWEIIGAMDRLNRPVIVDVYGPFREGVTESFFSNTAVNYCGVLSPDQVLDTLCKYDALLLPTYHRGEGYPGVILEAYSCGLPVISTNWNAIPEIVDKDSGILIEPQNVDQLVEAMTCLIDDVDKFNSLHQGALRKAEAFSADYWAEKFVQYSCSLL